VILYLYPEEWTGRRAREVHTLSTCVALARNGSAVTLVTAGGEPALRAQLRDIAGAESVAGLELVALSRSFGPIRSAAIFLVRFRRWLRNRETFTQGFTIHLKAATMLAQAGVPYLFEAHEIFAETPRPNEEVQRVLEEMERAALAGAAWRVATSSALAGALRARYVLPNDFAIIPNAGQAPLDQGIGRSDGPFVYCGTIADWKGVELAVEGARLAGARLRIVGGTEAEWRLLGQRCDTRGLEWRPRVALADLPAALAGACAGLIPTRPESGSGRYSCPMKLFDYARGGLPVISTALPALGSLQLGAWCSLVKEPAVEAWAAALRAFRFDATEAEAARRWAAAHTWEERARQIAAAFTPPARG
jgi:glycosyltransferase involved in cell wall biosynthesis